MKFSILINQLAVHKHGFSGETNLVDWALMDYIQQWMTNPKAMRMNDKVWINYKHVISEMPLIGLKVKSSISNRITKLVDLGLLDTEQDSAGKLFAALTPLAHSIMTFHDGEGAVHGYEQPVHENEQAVHGSEQAVQIGVHILNNQQLNNHLTKKTPAVPPKKKSNGGKSTETWNAYSLAYRNRYNDEPMRNAKANSLLCQFVDHVGKQDAPSIAAYYLSLNDRWYQTKFHDIPTLVQNAQAVRTQWVNQTDQTSNDVRTQERRSSMANKVQSIKEKILQEQDSE